jgi:hypothetical protein
VTTARTLHDADMIRHASVRGFVTLIDGTVVTLLAWRCSGGRDRARVAYDNGRTYTVPVSQVASPIDLQVGR